MTNNDDVIVYGDNNLERSIMHNGRLDNLKLTPINLSELAEELKERIWGQNYKGYPPAGLYCEGVNDFLSKIREAMK